MPPNLRIELVQAAPNQDYYPGGTVSGNLLLDVDEPKSYKQILVQFVGRSYVHWTESHTEGSGDNRRTVTRSYTSSEAYVDLTTIAWNNQQVPGGNLPPGQYSWPFNFNIPPTVPSSFEGSVGNIRYSIVATIVTGMLKFNHNVEVLIPVLQLVQITDPRLLQPVRQEVQKTVCCLCCASQPIVLNVAAPKTGFCLGESFEVHVSLENGSTRRVSIVALLKQSITYSAQGHHRWGGKTLVSVASDAIEGQASRNWDPTINVPTTDIAIIHESSCRNIKVVYSLEVVCRIPNALNLSTAIPLQLGNCRTDGEPSAATFPPPGPQQGLAPAAYPPPAQPGAPPPGVQPLAGYPPAPGPSGAPYPPPAAPTGGGAIGWSPQPVSDFPPPGPQETLADFSAPLIEKNLK
jgi:hypothetical protein